ncbi:F-box/kelch-repeat protein At3g06240-like [Lotus japonicus]|uniref:F-box/kelch-repeat protein At3g06240-like n=1 Tax=Lotus japonicus TaxID=34305 RepID=UPI00258DF119|nr:F-box/kelch-repeat protein At3g06240-like [Lotus japonicus]
MDVEGGWRQSYPFSEKINADFVAPIQIMGSCRGFLLLDCDESVFLWNPSTHVHKSIPSSPPVYPYGFESKYEFLETPQLYGFCYDSSKDDYLVAKFYVRGQSGSSPPAHVQIFSLRANVWKYIDFTDLPHLNLCEDFLRPGLLFNGTILHWLTYDYDKSMSVIIAFDLMELRFFEIPRPDNIAHDLTSCGDLWVHGRFLSLWVWGSDTNTIDILVMEKYRVQSSWTKTLVVSLTRRGKHLRPVCSTKNGDIIMASENGSKLAKYNDKGKRLEHCVHRDYRKSQVPMYTESIISLPSVTEQSSKF